MAQNWQDPVEVGRRIRAARAYLGESQGTFGERIKRSVRTIGKIEKGDPESVGPTPQARKRLAQAVADSGAPADILGLSQPLDKDGADAEIQEQLNELRRSVAETSEQVRELVTGHRQEQVPASSPADHTGQEEFTAQMDHRPAEPS